LASRTPGGKVTQIGLSFPCFSPRSTRHLVQVLHLSFPAVSALSLLTTTYHSYRSGHNPGSSDILLAQSSSSWPSRAASHISPPSPTISFPHLATFNITSLIQRLSTDFIQPSRYPYPAIIHILRHLDFGRLLPLLRSESTIPRNLAPQSDRQSQPAHFEYRRHPFNFLQNRSFS